MAKGCLLSLLAARPTNAFLKEDLGAISPCLPQVGMIALSTACYLRDIIHRKCGAQGLTYSNCLISVSFLVMDDACDSYDEANSGLCVFK